MSIGGLILAVILALVVLMFVVSPLIARRSEASEAGGDAGLAKQRERLLAYYDRVLRNLHDLDEDNALGKIEPELYARDRALWVERGVQALKALDTLNEQLSPASADDTAALDQAIDDAIEAAVRRAKQGVR